MTYNTFKLNKDFRRLYGRGKSQISPYLVTYCLKNRSGDINIGITAGKKLGNAVNRNRAKRVITAALRDNLSHIKPGYDFVFVARSRILAVKSTVVSRVFASQLKEFGIWNDSDEKTSD